MKLMAILKKYNTSLILLALLITFISLITYYRVKIQMNIGPLWDTYDFLSNALLFAGQGTGYSDLTRPPFLSFLTSIFFRLGYVSEVTIFIIDGILFIFGIIGFYLLLDLRFKPIISFLGSLLFATLPIMIWWVGTGYTDIASVSFSIWTLYFLILAVKKNSKYFCLSFPFLMIAFLTRYPAALIVLPIGLYLLINREYIKNSKDVLIGFLIAALILVPVLIFFSVKWGNPFLPFLSFFNTTQQSAPVENFAYNNNPFFYAVDPINYIGATSVTVILTILLGSIVYGITNLKKIKLDIIQFISQIKREKTFQKTKIVVFLVLTIIFLGTFGKLSYITSEIIFFLTVYSLYGILKDFKTIDIDLLFLSWFMVYFIFNSIYAIKVQRYFIPMAPAFIYFLIFGLTEITARFNIKIKNKDFTLSFLSIIFIFMIIISTVSFFNEIPKENPDKDTIISSNWLKNYDHNYENKIIYANYYWPFYSWYLRMNVNPMPYFKDGKSYYSNLTDYYPSRQDSIAYNTKLDQSNADYFFCNIRGLNLTSYKPIKRFGNIIIYKKDSD